MYRNNYPNDVRNYSRQYGRNSATAYMNSGSARTTYDYNHSDCMKSMPDCEHSDYKKSSHECSKCMESVPEMVLAMAYVPWQHFDALYDLSIGLQVGTIFPELNKPFRGFKGGMKCLCKQ